MLATILRAVSRGGAASDDFMRANGALGVTNVGGLPYIVYSGSWSIASHLATTSTAVASNPFAGIQTGLTKALVSATISPVGGDAIYFRIVDANNWVRVRLSTVQNSYQYISSYTPGPWVHDSNYILQPGDDAYNQNLQETIESGNVGGYTTNREIINGNIEEFWSRTVTANYSSGTTTTYYVIVEKCVASNVTQIGSATVNSGTTKLAASTNGSAIIIYTAGTQVLSLTDSTFSTSITQGFGRGGTTATDASAISAFSVASL